LTVLKSYIGIEPLKIQEAIDALDWAMEVLFQHTQFHEVAYGLRIRFRFRLISKAPPVIGGASGPVSSFAGISFLAYLPLAFRLCKRKPRLNLNKLFRAVLTTINASEFDRTGS
jgi:hypothetical protein